MTKREKEKKREKKEAWRLRKKLEASKKPEETRTVDYATKCNAARAGLTEEESQEFLRSMGGHKARLEENLAALGQYEKDLEVYVNAGHERLAAGKSVSDLQEPMKPEALELPDPFQVAEEIRRRMRPDLIPDGASQLFQTVEELQESHVWDKIYKMTESLNETEKSEFFRIFRSRMDEIAKRKLKAPFKFDFQKMVEEAKKSARMKPDYKKYAWLTHENEEDQSVEFCLQLTAFCLHIARTESGKTRDEALRCYLKLKDARVFHVGNEIYEACNAEASRYVTELSGLDYGPEKTNEELEFIKGTTLVERKNASFPEKFPFPTMFLGYGHGVNIPWSNEESPEPKKTKILGHLLTDEGFVVVFYEGKILENEPGRLGFQTLRESDEGWRRSYDLEPWITPHIVNIINEYRTFVLENEVPKSIRKNIKENRRPLGIEDYRAIPKPYYSLKLHAKLIKEKVKGGLGSPPRPRTYKTDVRGHERCRICRGPLPIDPKTLEKLKKRGYVIFASETLDVETYRRLSERGVGFKRSDEWLAIKATWVKDHMTSNDPGLPYVPAVRKLGEVRVKKPKVTSSWTLDPRSKG